MKKTVISFLFFISLFGYSQSVLNESDIKTTDVEYEFLTEKYALGNDSVMLKGYELKPFGGYDYEKFHCESKLLVESKTKKVKALLLIISKEKKNDDKVRYLCLPINNDELFEKFTHDYEKLGLSIYGVLKWYGDSIKSSYVQQVFNANNKNIKTTEEEYEFLTKKYPTVNNNYLLNGYELKPFFEETFEEKYIYNYQLFVESDTQNAKAILISITKLNNNDNKIKYLCMPLNNKELKKNYVKASINLGVNIGSFFDIANFSIASKILDDRYNAKKS